MEPLTFDFVSELNISRRESLAVAAPCGIEVYDPGRVAVHDGVAEVRGVQLCDGLSPVK